MAKELEIAQAPDGEGARTRKLPTERTGNYKRTSIECVGNKCKDKRRNLTRVE